MNKEDIIKYFRAVAPFSEDCCVFGQRVTDMKNRNVVLCGVALGGLVVWGAVWAVPLLATGAALKVAGNMARRAVGK